MKPVPWSLVISGMAVLSVSALGYAAFDRPLALYLKANVDGQIQAFFEVVTKIGQAEFYLVPSALLALWLNWKARNAATPELALHWRRLVWPPAFVFAAMAVSGIANSAIKFTLGRIRPRYLFEQDLYGFSPFNTVWAMNSYPSGHTQAAFAAMTSLAFVFPRYRVPLFALAVLVGLSRVVLTVHFLTDAIAGAWLAVAVTVLVRRAFLARGLDTKFR